MVESILMIFFPSVIFVFSAIFCMFFLQFFVIDFISYTFIFQPMGRLLYLWLYFEDNLLLPAVPHGTSCLLSFYPWFVTCLFPTLLPWCPGLPLCFGAEVEVDIESVDWFLLQVWVPVSLTPRPLQKKDSLPSFNLFSEVPTGAQPLPGAAGKVSLDPGKSSLNDWTDS